MIASALKSVVWWPPKAGRRNLAVSVTSPEQATGLSGQAENPASRLGTLAIVGILTAALLLSGCGHNVRLKPSPLAKGGDVHVRVELTYNRNDQLKIKVKAPNPSVYGANYTRYVAWVATPDRARVVNVGQIRVEKGKGELETLTPLRKFHLFLTVEEKGDVLQPGPQVVFEAPKEIDW